MRGDWVVSGGCLAGGRLSALAHLLRLPLKPLFDERRQHGVRVGVAAVAHLLLAPRIEMLPRHPTELLLLGIEALERVELLEEGDHVARVRGLLDELVLAALQLARARRDDCVARVDRRLGAARHVKVRAALHQRLVWRLGAAEHGGEARLAIVLALALGLDRLVVVLHVKRLEVVLQLDVERALRRRERHTHRLLAPRDLVDLCNVLPHVAVEEALRERVALRVPRGRVHLLEELEALDRRLLLLVLLRQLRGVRLAQPDAEPLGGL